MVYLIARDTYNISPREGDDRRSHPGPLRKNVTICPTQACTTPLVGSHVCKVYVDATRSERGKRPDVPGNKGFVLVRLRALGGVRFRVLSKGI